MIIALLDGLDLDGAVITVDALHTQRATADYVHGRGADFAFPVKDNQPGLFDALDALPWRDVPVTHATADRGHGRITTRTIQVMDAPGDLPFPHVSQAYLIERHVTALDGTALSDIAALGVTSLDATRASPQAIASLVRGQWAIESLHWLRATLYREDDSTVRTRSGPRAMAALQPRRRSPAPGRTTRHYRSHSLGQPVHEPALHHPRTYVMILKRPGHGASSGLAVRGLRADGNRFPVTMFAQ
jgi:predicted transposase YbfD/YdcC